jgi:hypothetical protein
MGLAASCADMDVLSKNRLMKMRISNRFIFGLRNYCENKPLLSMIV